MKAKVNYQCLKDLSDLLQEQGLVNGQFVLLDMLIYKQVKSKRLVLSDLFWIACFVGWKMGVRGVNLEVVNKVMNLCENFLILNGDDDSNI